MWNKMTSRRARPVWAAVALVAVLAIALSFPSVRAAAGSFLGLFRVQQIQFIQIDPSTSLNDLDSAFQTLGGFLEDQVQLEELLVALVDPGAKVAPPPLAQRPGWEARLLDAFLADGHEIASHGWRWISYQDVDEAVEREHMARAVETIARLAGAPPEGWYTGRDSANTRRLVVEHGGFVYSADSYADDLPHYAPVRTAHGERPLLIVPYTLDANDMRFATPQGFNTGRQFYAYLKDTFDALYAEGDPAGLDAPKMMSVGLHCRLAGRPGRAAALARFLDYVRRHDAAWVARRIDIARHWLATHPYQSPSP